MPVKERELSDRLQDTGINRKDTWKQRKVSGEAGKGIKETASTVSQDMLLWKPPVR